MQFDSGCFPSLAETVERIEETTIDSVDAGSVGEFLEFHHLVPNRPGGKTLTMNGLLDTFLLPVDHNIRIVRLGFL